MTRFLKRSKKGWDSYTPKTTYKFGMILKTLYLQITKAAQKKKKYRGKDKDISWNYHVFSGNRGRMLDSISKILTFQLKQQSNRDIPPLATTNAQFISQARTTAGEKQDIFLHFFIIFCSQFGKKYLAPVIGHEWMGMFIKSLRNIFAWKRL